MPILRTTLILALTATVAGACKAPRSAREKAEGDVTGRWTAESVAVGPPVDTGRIRWRLEMEQGAGGKLNGRGSMARGLDSLPFSFSGLRGESEIQLQIETRDGSATYHGGIADVRTITGEMYLPGDTIPVSFTRR